MNPAPGRSAVTARRAHAPGPLVPSPRPRTPRAAQTPHCIGPGPSPPPPGRQRRRGGGGRRGARAPAPPRPTLLRRAVAPLRPLAAMASGAAGAAASSGAAGGELPSSTSPALQFQVGGGAGAWGGGGASAGR
jgi:hypothetical protein